MSLFLLTGQAHVCSGRRHCAHSAELADALKWRLFLKKKKKIKWRLCFPLKKEADALRVNPELVLVRLITLNTV
jgi:hypothetical protein